MKTETTRYVAGFLFSTDRRRVVLIHKTHPAWQAGRLNGVGGKINQGEMALDAMMREFAEEAGRTISTWKHFCTLNGNGWSVEWFKAFSDVSIRTMTDERVEWFDIDEQFFGRFIPLTDTIPNVKWLVSLALDKDDLVAVVTDPAEPLCDNV